MNTPVRKPAVAHAVRRIAACVMIDADSRQPSPTPLEAQVTRA